MSLSNPTAFLWALLAIPIVIFYILKIRMRRVPVSTVMFWEQVFDEKTPRSIWQQLRHLLSLLLQLIFLALLVGSLADPYFRSDVRKQRRVVVVIDTSASMQADSGTGVSRLEAAREQVDHMIKSLKSHDEMALLVAGNQPQVVCGLTSHQRTLQKRLEEIPATDGPTQVKQALEVGRRLLAGHENGEVVIVTDGCFPQAAEIAAEDRVIWAQIGESTPNAGLTRFQVRRSLLDPIGFQILVEVSNFSQEAMNCKLDLSFNDLPLDVYPLELEPGQVWTEVFEKTSTDGGLLAAELLSPDDEAADEFAADNKAQAILPERLRLPVTLVTDGNWFLQRVLEANDAVDLTIASDVPESIPPNGVLVLHQKVPEKLPEGRIFVVQPKASTDLWQAQGAIDEPLVGKQDTSSDLLKHVRLDNVLMPEALRLAPTDDDARTLVESVSGDPIYLHIPRAVGDVVVLTVNLDQGDLPLRTAFPIMLTNALSWFADGKGELLEALPTGKITEVGLPADLQTVAQNNDSQLTLTAPDESETQVRVEDGRAMLGPLGQAGLWTLRGPTVEDEETTDASPQLVLACNLMNPQESNLQVAEEIEPRQEILSAGFGGRPVWYYLVLAAIVLTLTEWILFHRRWIT